MTKEKSRSRKWSDYTVFMRVKLDTPLFVGEICKATNALPDTSISPMQKIEAVCTDSRECLKGDLFIALCGEHESGEKYVENATEKNCISITTKKHRQAMQVTDASQALLDIAKLYKSKTNIRYTVAVTGSVGKSTTVKFLSKILRIKYNVHSPIGNFNNHLGVPLTILAAKKSTDVLVLEFGMNHENEISILSQCAEPNLGIITSIGTSHIGNLGSLERIAKAKLEITHGMLNGTLLLPYGERLLNNIKNAVYVGRNTSLSDYSLNNGKDGLLYLRSHNGDILGISFFDSREHLLSDLAFAISSAQLLGLTDIEIIQGVKSITEADLRQRFIVLDDYTIFDDSYNASLESITADLEYLDSLKKPYSAFLGDVFELGEKAKAIHTKIGYTAAKYSLCNLYLLGNYAHHVARGAVEAGMDPSHIFINDDVSSSDISIEHIKRNHISGEVILFKASHKLRFDKIADKIVENERSEYGQ